MKRTTSYFVLTMFLAAAVFPAATHAALINARISSEVMRDGVGGALAPVPPAEPISVRPTVSSDVLLQVPPEPPIAPVLHVGGLNDVRDDLPPAPSAAPVTHKTSSDGPARTIALPPVPPIAPALKTLADCSGLTIKTPAPKSDVGEKTDSEVSPGKLESSDPAGQVSEDIENMVFVVMINASKDQQDDLKGIMDQVQNTLKEKTSLRAKVSLFNGEKDNLHRLVECETSDKKVADQVNAKIDADIQALADEVQHTATPGTPVLFPFQVTSDADLKSYAEHKATGTPGVENIVFQNNAADVKLKRNAKLFGFLPISYTADVVTGDAGTTVRGPWWLFAAKDDLGDLKDSLSEMGQQDQLKLQSMMDSREKVAQMLSDIMKKVAEAESNIAPNLK